MELETLHSRQKQLLALLKEQQQTITSQELAARMNVSDRTVRNDVRILNAVLTKYGVKIETIRGKGIRIETEGASSTLLDNPMYSGNTLQTREDRSNYLIVKLLLSDTGLQLGELEDEMFVSRTTLENDINFVRKLLTTRRPYLNLIRGENRISIEDDEWKKRLLLTKIIAESWDFNSREGVLLQNSPLQNDAIEIIFDCTKRNLKHNNVKLDDYDLIAFVFTIAVAEFRIRTGHPLDNPPAVTTDSLSVADFVNRLVDDIEAHLHARFDSNERKNIMLSLSFRQIPGLEPTNRQDILHLVDQNTLRTVDLFLNKLLTEYGVDFSWDERLYADLAYQIFRLEKGLRYSYERKNPMLHIIKTRFIFFFELSMVIRDCFQVVYGMDISEDEWSYFAGYLITSANRAAKIRFPNGIPVAFVSHLGRSNRQMLASQINGIYGNVIELNGPFSIYEKERIIGARPRLILSTVKLEKVRPELINIPHMTISTTLKDEMFIKLNRRIKEINEQIFFPPLPEPPRYYFDEKLFFPNLDLSAEGDIISYLAQHMVELGYAAPECISRVIDREYLSSTAMEYGIAIPRVHATGSSKTIIGAAVLKNPIHWGGQKINLVFLLSVADGDLPIFGTLLNYLANVLCCKVESKKLAQIQTYNDLLDLL
jgi:transcriptional antiterminator/mannitol/fructose-specific phosphotransferase system IIA component (Ntr-type)